MKEIPRVKARKIIQRFRNEMESGGDVSHLNITAMMDMMSILLVFLLMQFAAEHADLTISNDIQPPKSSSNNPLAPALSLTISTSAVLVDGDPIVRLLNGTVDASVKRDGVNGYYITPLVDLLTKHANRLKKVEALGGQKFHDNNDPAKGSDTILLIVDRSIPYRLLTEVLYSAGQAEFRNYRLVVLQKDK